MLGLTEKQKYNFMLLKFYSRKGVKILIEDAFTWAKLYGDKKFEGFLCSMCQTKLRQNSNLNRVKAKGNFIFIFSIYPKYKNKIPYWNCQINNCVLYNVESMARSNICNIAGYILKQIKI